MAAQNSEKHLLVIEDDKVDQMAFSRFAETPEFTYSFDIANSISAAHKYLKSKKYDLILTDFYLGDGNAFEIIDLKLEMPIIVITGTGSEEVAVKAIKSGAFEYIIKDLEGQYLKLLPVTIENALKHHKNEQYLKFYHEELENIVKRRTADLIKEIKTRQKTEQNLSESENKFRAMANSAQDALITVDSKGAVTFWNHAAEKMFGFTSDEIFGQDLHKNIVPQKYRKAARQGFKNFKLTGKGTAIGKTVELSGIKKSGQEFPIELSLSSMKIKDEWHAVAIIRNLSERKILEEILIESELRYKALTEASFEAIFIIDDNMCLEQNPRAEKMFGYTLNEAMGQPITNLIVPENRNKVEKKIASGKANTFFSNALKKDGSTFPAEIQCRKSKYKGYPVTVVALRDISDRVMAEKAVKSSEEKYRDMVEKAGVAITIEDNSGELLFFNDHFCKIFGYSREEMNKLNYTDLVHPDDLEKVKKNYENRLHKKTTQNRYQCACLKKDNSVFYIEVDITDYIKDEKVLGTRNYMRDITQRKKAESQLKKLSTALYQNPVSVVITNKKGEIEYVNPKFTRVTGYSEEEVIGKNPRILKSGEHPEEFYKEMWTTIINGETWTGEIKNTTKSGETFWEDVVIGPIKDDQGNITDFVALKEDITAKKELELQLLQSQKLEAIGHLAGGVAHDFNNLLTIINGYSSLILDHQKEDSDIYRDISQIAIAGKRASSLTQQLLAFSRKQIIQPEILDLNKVINDTSKMLKRLIAENIELHKKLSTGTALISADSGQLNQIIMNLVVNARDAMPDGGHLIIETNNVTVEKNSSAEHFNAESGDYTVLSISDTGIGMDSETQKHIFEPFYTTKETGKGTGLGLSTVYGIVKQNNGYIGVYSEPGQGSSFKIYFPKLAETDKEFQEKIKSEYNLYVGSEKILVVEDEDSVRVLTTKILEKAGYQVKQAISGTDALKWIKDENGEIDLLLTDMVMPEMGGKQLADQIKKIYPSIKVIFMSGYTDETISKSGFLEKGTIFLQKPFSPNNMLKLVRETIDTAN